MRVMDILLMRVFGRPQGFLGKLGGRIMAQEKHTFIPWVVGLVDLRCDPADDLPFADETFTKAMSINSTHLWPDPLAGLREIRRVLKVGGKVALGFTTRARQRQENVFQWLAAAGFYSAAVAETGEGFCVIATKQ